MNPSRRRWLSATAPASLLSVAVAAGLLRPGAVLAAESPALAVLQDLRRADPAMSTAIGVKAPDIAEDGSNVFVSCDCRLPDVDALVFFVDRNPQPLVASFYLAPEVEPRLQLRLKVAESANIWVVARSQGRFFKSAKWVKVTRGGCGLGVN